MLKGLPCLNNSKEQLISFVQDQDSGKADVKFLAIDDVPEEYDSANAYAVKGMLVKQIAAAKLEKSKLTGLATDGCSVMTGKRTGVAVKMRQECKLMFTVYATA